VKDIDLEIEARFAEINNVYNSGNNEGSVLMSKELLEKYPDNIYTKYMYAIHLGDYSCHEKFSEEEKAQMLEETKSILQPLMEPDVFSQFIPKYQGNLRNEYYWFFKMHKAQYELGIEEIQKGKARSGHYSACVGASSEGFRLLREQKGNLEEVEKWARCSLEHFFLFEKENPHWYNINYFASQSYLLLGEYHKAKETFEDMFRKQGKSEVGNLAKFVKIFHEIKTLRE
jgi:hypothetical protein